MTSTEIDEKFMREALAEARAAAAVGSTRTLRRMQSSRPCALSLGRSVAGAFPIARSM